MKNLVRALIVLSIAAPASAMRLGMLVTPFHQPGAWLGAVGGTLPAMRGRALAPLLVQLESNGLTPAGFAALSPDGRRLAMETAFDAAKARLSAHATMTVGAAATLEEELYRRRESTPRDEKQLGQMMEELSALGDVYGAYLDEGSRAEVAAAQVRLKSLTSAAAERRIAGSLERHAGALGASRRPETSAAVGVRAEAAAPAPTGLAPAGAGPLPFLRVHHEGRDYVTDEKGTFAAAPGFPESLELRVPLTGSRSAWKRGDDSLHEVPVRLDRRGDRVKVSLAASATHADRAAARLFRMAAETSFLEVEPLVIADAWQRHQAGWVIWYMDMELPFLTSAIENWRLEFVHLLERARGREDYLAVLRQSLTLAAARMHVRGLTLSADTYRWALAAMDGWDWRPTPAGPAPAPTPAHRLGVRELILAAAGAAVGALALWAPLGGAIVGAVALLMLWHLISASRPIPQEVGPLPQELDESIFKLLSRLGSW